MGKLLVHPKLVLALIILNALVIFAQGFQLDLHTMNILEGIDIGISLFFVAEIFLKVKASKQDFFKSYGNWFDFIVVAISIPSVIVYFIPELGFDISYLTVFRVLRVTKSFRFIKFIPNIAGLLRGITRALKSSVLVLVGFIIYVFVGGVLSNYLFSPNPNFDNPLNAMYTIFQIFTIEGWFDVAGSIASKMSGLQKVFTYLYFVIFVLTGGILGVSLVNSIFVDAMLQENNNNASEKLKEIESKLNSIEDKLDKLKFK